MEGATQHSKARHSKFYRRDYTIQHFARTEEKTGQPSAPHQVTAQIFRNVNTSTTAVLLKEKATLPHNVETLNSLLMLILLKHAFQDYLSHITLSHPQLQVHSQLVKMQMHFNTESLTRVAGR